MSPIVTIRYQVFDVSNEILTASLNQYCIDLKSKFPDVPVSALFKTNLTHGCSTLVKCFQENAVTGPMMRDGAIKMGQHVREGTIPPYQHPGYSRTTVDIRKILSYCTTPISNDQLNNLELNLPELVHHFNAHGYSNDQVMNDLNIMRMPDHTSRDNLVAWRRGPLLFTHHEQVEQFSLYKEGRSQFLLHKLF